MACVTWDSQDTWTGEYDCILYTIPGCTWDGLFNLGFSRHLDRGVRLYTVYHPRMYLGWLVLPGILKTLGQGGKAVYCIPFWDALGMACVTWDSQDTWTGGCDCIMYTIPGCTWDGLCYLGFSRCLDRRIWLYTVYHPGMYLGWLVLPCRDSQDTWYGCILYTIPGCIWDVLCYLGFSDKGVWLCSVYHSGCYMESLDPQTGISAIPSWLE